MENSGTDAVESCMARPLAALVFILGSLAPAVAAAQTASPPEVVGGLVGPLAAPPSPAGVQVYGTDLGWTFEHRGALQILFGDTWPYARFLCDVVPENDDSQATLPLAPAAGVPALTFVTPAAAPTTTDPIRVFHGTEELSMGFGSVPITAFSDGVDAFGLFGRTALVPCTRRTPRGRPSCRPHRHLTCATDVGECTPLSLGVPTPCDLTTGAGCAPGQTCGPSPTGLCVDEGSSQNDGTPASLPFIAARQDELAEQDPTHPVVYRNGTTLATNRFINATSRTVGCFTGRACGSDYRPGHGALLVWGRPGFTAEQGRQAQLYLMVHRLPIPRDKTGQLRFRPRYFAGLHPESGEPLWSRREAHAKPLALDGVPGGSPHEVLPIVDQMAISWVGDPVNAWVMLYGGNLADYLLRDPANARPGPKPGAIQVRFAANPWGPWTPPEPHLFAGSPIVVGDAYGPGGLLFHPLCVDAGGAVCAPSDPTRPVDVFLPGCPRFGAVFDNGFFYGPNIIDAYTRADGAGGADVVWNVSTWNPYGVALLRSNVRPATVTTPPTCGARTGPVAGLGGRVSHFRWCAAGE
jgi:hypothetical protein